MISCHPITFSSTTFVPPNRICRFTSLTMSTPRFSNKTLAYIALGVICIVWGTTYTAIKLAVRDFPPFLLVGMRQTTAGLIMLAMALVAGRLSRNDPGYSKLTWQYIGFQMLTGLATITGGNGFITWGMRFVSSGLASVIGALTPVVVLAINFAWHRRGERLSPYTLAGVLLGFAGLGFIFNHGWDDFLNPDYRWGIAGCFASCFTWSLGTVMAKRFNDQQVSPVVNAGIQVTTGGLGGFVLSGLFDTSYTIHHTWEGWGALVYLITIGSALAFTLYMFVLKQLSATAASIYTYINPTVAVILGWLVLHEDLSVFEIIGMCITLAGVWLVNKGES